jgi:arylsulfatase A-like enzyme
MRGPGVPHGRRIPALVELVDIVPTVLSLLAIPVPGGVQGHDLSSLFGPGEPVPVRSEAFVDGILGGPEHPYARARSAVIAERKGERWSYITKIDNRLVDGSYVFEARAVGKLFHLDRDPGEQHDVASAHPELRAELESLLIAWYRRNEVLVRQLDGQEPSLDLLSKEEIEELEALGYLR